MRLVHRPSGPLRLHWRSRLHPYAHFTSIIPNIGASWFLATLIAAVIRSSPRPESGRQGISQIFSGLLICLSLVARARHGAFPSTTALSSKGGTRAAK